MHRYTVQINQEVDNITKELINDYWLFNNNEFEYSLNQLADKYNLTVSKITKLIKDNSTCTVSIDCTNCNKTFPRIVDTKGFFKVSKHSSILCSECQEKQDILIQEKKQEDFYKYLEEKIINEEKKNEKFLKAIQTKQWLKLNPVEKDILIKIIESNGVKNAIRKTVFNSNFYDKSIWTIINRLERKGLIFVERNNDNSVICFDFHKSLIDYISNDIPVKTTNSLSFSLSKKAYKNRPKQPDYAGTFTLPYDVLLKAHEAYLYGGWILSDGSINLKFTPVKDVNKVKQTEIEDESSAYNGHPLIKCVS